MRGFVLALLLCACERVGEPRVATGGDAVRGKHVIERTGCGACHRIPGMRRAIGVVGPPLDSFARRSFIAGRLPNNPKNLVQWLRDPPAVDSRTAMPRLDLDDQQARDVAAYLYTLD